MPDGMSTPTRMGSHGPEVSLNLLGLRLSLMAAGSTFMTPLGDRTFLFGVGLGYI